MDDTGPHLVVVSGFAANIGMRKLPDSRLFAYRFSGSVAGSDQDFPSIVRGDIVRFRGAIRCNGDGPRDEPSIVGDVDCLLRCVDSLRHDEARDG